MNIINRGDAVMVRQGQYRGRRGNVIGLIGNGDSLVVEVQLIGAPHTTMHRTSEIVRDPFSR